MAVPAMPRHGRDARGTRNVAQRGGAATKQDHHRGHRDHGDRTPSKFFSVGSVLSVVNPPLPLGYLECRCVQRQVCGRPVHGLGNLSARNLIGC